MLGFVSEQVKKNCWNLYDSYGEICVHCGGCAKDKKTRYKARISVLEDRIRDKEDFDLWFDDPAMRAIQEKNIASDIEAWKKELEKYRKLLYEEEHREQWNEELKRHISGRSDAELLDSALSLLVDFEIDMPCDVLNDVDDTCADTCKYECPQKECWLRYLEYRVKEEHHEQKQAGRDVQPGDTQEQ